MQHLQARKIWLKIRGLLPFIVVVVLALALRFYLFPKHVSFDADQEEIATKAKEIIQGNLLLLGPKTSLGGFSIGPGFVYLCAVIAYFLKADPISVAYMSVFSGVSFIILTYYLFNKVFSKKTGFAISLLLAVSITLIIWDQSPWAPSLFYVSELLIFYGAYISKKNIWGLPLIMLGFGLGFQAHFAVFLLILPIAIYLLIYKPTVTRKTVLISVIIGLLSVSPVVIFDLLHNFANSQRLLSIFSLGTSGMPPSKMKLIYTLVANSTNIIWPDFSMALKYIIFGLILVISFILVRHDKVKRPLFVLSTLMLFIPLVLFMGYKSSFSEYYLMTAVVPFIFIVGYLVERSKIAIVLPILLIAVFLNIKSFSNYNRPMNLYAKEEIVKEVIKMGGKEGYGVSLSTKLGYGFGYKYLFDYYGAKPDIPPLKNQKKIFTIVVPPGFDGIEALYEVDGVGLRWEGI